MLTGSNESRRRLRELEDRFEDGEWIHDNQPLGGVVIMTRWTLAAEWKRMNDSLHDRHRPFVPSCLFPHVDATLCEALDKCYLIGKNKATAK